MEFFWLKGSSPKLIVFLSIKLGIFFKIFKRFLKEKYKGAITYVSKGRLYAPGFSKHCIQGRIQGGGRTFAPPDRFRGGGVSRFQNRFSIALNGKKS